MRSLSLLLVPVLAAVALVAATPALADGDPASDYLLTQPLFLPFEPTKVSDVAQNQLREVLASSKEKGYEVRVALIGTRTDLGAVGLLWGKPQRYADFLGQELVYFWKGPTLVVMPQGYGIFQKGKPLAAEKAVLAKLPPPSTTDAVDGDTLAASAENAVRALAEAERRHAARVLGDRAELVLEPRPRRPRRRRDPALRARSRRPLPARPAAEGGRRCVGPPSRTCPARPRGAAPSRRRAAVAAARAAPTPTCAGSRCPTSRRRRTSASTIRTGKLVSLAQERGNWVVVTFLYTTCPDVCPVIAGNLNAALRTPTAKQAGLHVLSITVDPSRDTPAAVRTYVRNHQLLPTFRWALGTEQELAPVWQAYNVVVMPGAKKTVSHSTIQLLVDPTGHERAVYDATVKPADVVSDLKTLQHE